MISISLCMIVRDEESTIKRCLDSIKDIVDEIIIVDTGSVDNTKEIIKEYTEKIYDFAWVDDFSVARNFSFSKATKEYVMWLDADDVLLDEDKIKLEYLKKNLSKDVDTIIMKYNLTSKTDGSVTASFYRERIVKRSMNFKWCDPVHEYILYGGNIIKENIAITHKKEKAITDRNLSILNKFIDNGNELSDRNLFYYARELFCCNQYEKAKKYYKKFLDTENGLASNYLDSCIELSKIYEAEDNSEEALNTLLKFFQIDSPRAEICCEIGYYFKRKGKLDSAISWFKLASFTEQKESLGAISHKSWDYIPYMELCSCYYRKGMIDEAILYNEKAAKNYGEDDKICHNRTYLAIIKEKLNKSNKNKE